MGHWYFDEYGEPRQVDDFGNVRPIQAGDFGEVPEAQAAVEEAEVDPASRPVPGRGQAALAAHGSRLAGTGTKASTSVAYGQSEETGGYDQERVDQAEKSAGTYEEKARREGEARKAELLGPLQQAQTLGEQANENIGDIQALQAMENQQGLIKEAKFNHDYAIMEANAMAAAATSAHSAKMAYLTQVQAYQTMKVNPNELWGEMGGDDRTRALAAVFVSDFLGAKGIKTSVMDTINRAVDRSMDSQIANINKQGAVSEHFRNLYHMTVQESATEEEARTRLRGMYYAQLEKEIATDLAQYDAPMAQALTDKAIAELRMAFGKEVAIPLSDMIDKRTQAAIDTWTGLQETKMRVSAENKRTESNERIAVMDDATRRYALDKPQPGTMAPDPRTEESAIYDPESKQYVGNDIGGKEQARDTRARLEGAHNLQDILAKITEFQDTHPAYYEGPLAKGIHANDPDYTYIRALYSSWMTQRMLALTGKAATDKQYAKIEEQEPPESWLVNPVKATAEMAREADVEIRSLVNSRIPNLVYEPLQSSKNLAAKGRNVIDGDEPRVATEIEQSFDTANRADSMDVKDGAIEWQTALDTAVRKASETGSQGAMTEAARMLRQYEKAQYEKDSDDGRARGAYAEQLRVELEKKIEGTSTEASERSAKKYREQGYYMDARTGEWTKLYKD